MSSENKVCVNYLTETCFCDVEETTLKILIIL